MEELKKMGLTEGSMKENVKTGRKVIEPWEYENEYLPDLIEAIVISHQCGFPCKVSLYDEEGIEGWRFDHPDGREWTVIGGWEELPMHPLVERVIEKATGMNIEYVLRRAV